MQSRASEDAEASRWDTEEREALLSKRSSLEFGKKRLTGYYS